MPRNSSVSAAPSTTSYAILGLLGLRRWTTYELTKQVQRSLNWFWPRAERKLYDEPKALVSTGLATAHREYTGRRASTVYEITPAGRTALRGWLDEPSEPPATEFEAMVKVFFADAGSLPQLTATLDRVEETAAARLADIAALARQMDEGSGPFPRRRHISALTLQLGAQQEEGVLLWARWARRQVGRWRSTVDAGGWDDRAVLRELVARIDELVPRGPADE